MEYNPDELDTVPDLLFSWLFKNNPDFDLNLAPFFKPIRKRYAGCQPKAIQRWCNNLLNAFKNYIGAK